MLRPRVLPALLLLLVLVPAPAAAQATAPEGMFAPTGMRCSAGRESHTVSWDPFPGARKYQVYRSVEAGDPELLGVTESLSWTDEDTQRRGTYTYFVIALTSEGNSGPASCDVRPSALRSVALSIGLVGVMVVGAMLLARPKS